MRTKTKEQLIEENARLSQEKTTLEEGDNTRRVTISKLLGSVEVDRSYGVRSETVKNLSWPEIYFRLGGLMERQNKFDYMQRIVQVENNVQMIDEALTKVAKKLAPPRNEVGE